MDCHKYLLVLSFAAFNRADAQEPIINLEAARSQAQRTNPELLAAREAVAVARAQERQAGAFLNPLVTYRREEVANSVQSTTQDIISAEQTVEWPGVQSARRNAARQRRSAAEARLAYAESQIAFEAVRAYAAALAADRQARLADTVTRAFTEAGVISERRLREGDISGFAARRIRLESARYLALRADATLRQRTARVALATLVGDSAGDGSYATRLAELPTMQIRVLPTDSLIKLAMVKRADLVAATLDVEVAQADALRTSRERFPAVTLTGGSKREELSGGTTLSGLVAGIALPLPLWDRRGGAVAASNAEIRRRSAELMAVRRRVTREVSEAASALRAGEEQLAAVGASVQSDAAAALRAAQTAYSEGEITLLEWLDTVRAYQETESTVVNLRSEVVIRAAALERAVGVPLFPELR